MQTVINVNAVKQINHLMHVVHACVQCKAGNIALCNTNSYSKAKDYLLPNLAQDYKVDFVEFVPWVLKFGTLDGHYSKFFTGAGKPTTVLSNLGTNNAIAFAVELCSCVRGMQPYSKVNLTSDEKAFANKIIKALENKRDFDTEKHLTVMSANA